MHWLREHLAHHRTPEAQAAHDRLDRAQAAADARRDRADQVTESLVARVFKDNHIAEGVARIWGAGK